MRTISATTARRLAITRQRLAGKISKPNAHGIFEVVKDLGFLQLDPTNVVAPSHQLVVFSRVGPYQRKHLDPTEAVTTTNCPNCDVAMSVIGIDFPAGREEVRLTRVLEVIRGAGIVSVSVERRARGHVHVEAA